MLFASGASGQFVYFTRPVKGHAREKHQLQHPHSHTSSANGNRTNRIEHFQSALKHPGHHDPCPALKAQVPGMRQAQSPALGSPQSPNSPVSSGSAGHLSLGELGFAAAALPITGAIYLWPQMKDQYLFNRHTTL